MGLQPTLTLRVPCTHDLRLAASGSCSGNGLDHSWPNRFPVQLATKLLGFLEQLERSHPALAASPLAKACWQHISRVCAVLRAQAENLVEDEERRAVLREIYVGLCQRIRPRLWFLRADGLLSPTAAHRTQPNGLSTSLWRAAELV